MFKRLFNIFRAESDSGQITILVVISVILQFIFNNFGDAIINSIMYFVLSWFIAYLIAKYANGNQMQWWKTLYIIIIIGSIISFFF